MKVINNYKDFLDELELHNKKITVTEEFYNWLKDNVGYSLSKDNATKGPNAIFHGAEIYKVKEKNNVNI